VAVAALTVVLRAQEVLAVAVMEVLLDKTVPRTLVAVAVAGRLALHKEAATAAPALSS